MHTVLDAVIFIDQPLELLKICNLGYNSDKLVDLS